MRKSGERHPLAVLRRLLGDDEHGPMKVEEMAKLIDCSVSTVQSIEVNDPERFELSGELAMRISTATGVGVGWLLKGDPKAPPFQDNGQPFTKEIYEALQAAKQNTAATAEGKLAEAFICCRDTLELQIIIAGIVLAAFKSGKGTLACYRISVLLGKLAQEFGMDSSLEPELLGLDWNKWSDTWPGSIDNWRKTLLDSTWKTLMKEMRKEQERLLASEPPTGESKAKPSSRPQ